MFKTDMISNVIVTPIKTTIRLEKIMDLVCRLFYTVFSMAMSTIFLIPIVFFIRIMISKSRGRGMIYIWTLLFFRALIPVSMSSPASIIPSLNRSFHVFLSQLGLTMENTSGILTGWLDVFTHDIQTDSSFQVCAIIWFLGVILFWIYISVQQSKVRKYLKKDSSALYGKIYQKKGLMCPVMTGIFRLKIYIPDTVTVSEAKYLLKHLETHEAHHDGIFRSICLLALSLQWFNPLMWAAYYFFNVDIELAADDLVVSNFDTETRKQYAQEIINMKKGNDSYSPTLSTFQEANIQTRATRMLYYDNNKKQDKRIATLLLLLCFLWWFMLRPVQVLWNKDAGQSAASSSTEAPLFDDKSTDEVLSIDDIMPTADNSTDAPTDDGGDSSTDDGKYQHFLADDSGKTIMEVTTEKDNSENEVIGDIIINPDSSPQKFKEVKGYFCDLIWAPVTDDNTDRYAQLIYNGTKSQTFMLYDTKNKKIFYEQEDGNSILERAFNQYSDNEIEFSESGAVVYSLQEMEGDTLKIGFAADTSGGITVNGTYKYNVETKVISDLSYSQNTN